MTQWLPGTTRNRIQDLCRDRNITQSGLAQQVEIDKSTLSRFLNEKTNSLSEACIIRIAESACIASKCQRRQKTDSGMKSPAFVVQATPSLGIGNTAFALQIRLHNPFCCRWFKR